MTQRWQLVDPLSVRPTYTFERNPSKAKPTAPNKKLDTQALAPLATPTILGIKQTDPPFDWDFEGTLDTQAMHDELLAWSQIAQIVQVIDDLARSFYILPTEFQVTERAPTPNKAWRFSYVFKALLFPNLPTPTTVTIVAPSYAAYTSNVAPSWIPGNPYPPVAQTAPSTP